MSEWLTSPWLDLTFSRLVQELLYQGVAARAAIPKKNTTTANTNQFNVLRLTQFRRQKPSCFRLRSRLKTTFFPQNYAKPHTLLSVFPNKPGVFQPSDCATHVHFHCLECETTLRLRHLSAEIRSDLSIFLLVYLKESTVDQASPPLLITHYAWRDWKAIFSDLRRIYHL